MIAMRMMQVAADEVIDMVAVGYGFVPAVWAVLMRATEFRGAAHGIFGAHGDHMFVDVIPMHMVEMTLVNVVHMTIMADRGMPAVGTVLIGMVGKPLNDGGLALSRPLASIFIAALMIGLILILPQRAGVHPVESRV